MADLFDTLQAITLLRRGNLHATEAAFVKQVERECTPAQRASLAAWTPAKPEAITHTSAALQVPLFSEGDTMPQTEIAPHSATGEAEKGLF